jgi:hypothetical protein
MGESYMKRYLIFFVVLALLLLPTVFAQFDDEENSSLIVTVGTETCALVLKDSLEAEATAEASEVPELPEATEVAEIMAEATEAAEGEMTVLTVGDDCDANAFRLASNGTLWIAISLEGEEDWQVFEAVEGDTSAPNFDRRGRFIGCRNPNEGEQVCRVQWEYEGTSYLIEIPIYVGDAFTAGVPISTAEPDSSTPTGSGEWGACGSCSTCGGPENICVLSPDGLCLADPATCGPQATEER